MKKLIVLLVILASLYNTLNASAKSDSNLFSKVQTVQGHKINTHIVKEWSKHSRGVSCNHYNPSQSYGMNPLIVYWQYGASYNDYKSDFEWMITEFNICENEVTPELNYSSMDNDYHPNTLIP